MWHMNLSRDLHMQHGTEMLMECMFHRFFSSAEYVDHVHFSKIMNSRHVPGLAL